MRFAHLLLFRYYRAIKRRFGISLICAAVYSFNIRFIFHLIIIGLLLSFIFLTLKPIVRKELLWRTVIKYIRYAKNNLLKRFHDVRNILRKQANASWILQLHKLW
jgi:hypothetical protein